MVNLDSFSNLIPIISTHGQIFAYITLFILMSFEGPIAIYFSSFAASLGYLNIYIIIFIGLLGGIIPDTLLFFVGAMLTKVKEKKLIQYFGLNERRVEWLEKNVKEHPVKILAFVKHVPPFPIPGLILCGYMKMNTKKFLLIDSLMNFFGVLVFSFLGYYSGLFAINLSPYIKWSSMIILLFFLLAILIYFFNKLIWRVLLGRIIKNRKN